MLANRMTDQEKDHAADCMVGTTLVDALATLIRRVDEERKHAKNHKGKNFYSGYVGSDPRTHSRWRWDRDFNDVIRFACND